VLKKTPRQRNFLILASRCKLRSTMYIDNASSDMYVHGTGLCKIRKDEVADRSGSKEGCHSDINDERGGNKEPLQHLLSKDSNEVDEEEDTGNTDRDDEPRSSPISCLEERIKSIISIYADQSGSLRNLCQGFSVILLCGIILGVLMPHDETFPSPWYRSVSSIIGYTYFMSWSVSYYPQIIMVNSTGSISGLSTDATVLVMLNSLCYAIYNVFFFWDRGIQQEYRDENPDTPLTVESNDVAFSIHALIVSLALACQVAYYNGFRTSPLSKVTIALLIGFILGSAIYITCILLQIRGCRWIDFFHTMALLKIVLATSGYIPQLVLNYKRKSTKGFNMWNIYLDFGGGLLSMSQLIFDSIDLGDLASGIMGNWAKLVLGMITLLADSAFLTQHYILYPNVPDSLSNLDHDYTLLDGEEIKQDEITA